jgi:hypothetical protein
MPGKPGAEAATWAAVPGGGRKQRTLIAIYPGLAAWVFFYVRLALMMQ